MLESAVDPCKVKLIPASIQSKSVIKNLARFYVYELSRYNGEDIPENGLFKAHDACFNYDSYWREAGHYPFIIRVDDHLAGFVLVNQKGSRSEVDWHLAEFFILAGFQNKGVGRHVVGLLLNRFSGLWEVAQMPNNLPAIHFWRSVIQQFTSGQYTETQQQVHNPHPHEMIIQRFRSPAAFTKI
ncbi:MAG TPA: GNAT family N-acetyltransferase [Legionella sp.]|nr:GNAT family N-acetyltransferase [Legionella sp.]